MPRTTEEESDRASQQSMYYCIRNMPNHTQLRKQVGKKQVLMWASSIANDHPDAPLLDTYAKKFSPVDCGTN